MDFDTVRTVLQGAMAATTLVDHHLDSYDDFLDNLLPAIVAEPPHKVIELRGQLHHFQFGRVAYTPATVMEADGMLRQVTPEECRLRALDYTVSVLVTVTHSVHAKPRRPAKGALMPELGELVERNVFHDVKLCHLPLMVGSRRCVTRRSGDSPETGGFFVIRGNDKAVIPQEKMRINVPCVFRAVGHGGKYQWTCEVRSWTEAKIRTTSTLNMFATPDTGGQTPTVAVTIPYSKHGLVPLRVMFALLGCPDVAVMRACILGCAPPDTELAAELARRVDAILDGIPQDVARLSRSGLLRWVVTRSRNSDAAAAESSGTPGTSGRVTDAMAEVDSLVSKEVLPHLATPLHKWYYLGMMARKLLHVQLSKHPQFVDSPGRRTKDDRDDFRFKAVDTTGMLMALLFRRHFRAFKDKLVRQYRATVEKKLVMPNDLIGLYSDISQNFRTAFTSGVWQVKPQKAGATGQGNGVVQMVSRINVVSALAHLQKINAPLNKDGKMAKPRLLHVSHYGRICPCDTPEGHACGLNKHAAHLLHIRTGYPAEWLFEPLARLAGFAELTDVAQLTGQLAGHLTHRPVPLYVNGILLGVVPDGAAAAAQVRSWRRRGDMAYDVTVYHSAQDGEVHVNCDSGVLMWPLLRADMLGVVRDVAARVPVSAVWPHLLALGCVEYVDNLEESNLLVAAEPRDLVENNMRYTHVVLHGSLILGDRAALIPYSNLNQSPRNVYASGMMKQAISVPQETPSPRFDTISYSLDTLQAPLVKTLMADLLAPEHSTIGQNVVCAIMCSGGYNQEDSIIVNKSAIERGLLRVTACRTHREHDKASSNDVTTFQQPRAAECVGRSHADYTAIEADGLPTPGTKVAPNMVIIGKTATTSPLGEVNSRTKTKQHVVRDQSVVSRTHEDMVVDKVVSATGEDGSQLVRVQLRASRIPEVGDKLSSRHSQKGVIGAVVPQEDMPFSASGMTPDIIINPHCMPSRMSIGHLMEALASKVAALEGAPVDGTPFDDSDTLAADLGARLLAAGHASSGMERLMDGTTGEMLDAAIFMCPTYYLRLKHMVADKLHARSRGPMQILTRQPTGGRSKDGGLRIGEMERDCIISHGAAHFLRDRLLYASDHYVAMVCGRCGGLAQGACDDAEAVRATSMQLGQDTKYCRACRSAEHIHPVEMPYAFKTFTQELQAMHVGVKFDVQ